MSRRPEITSAQVTSAIRTMLRDHREMFNIVPLRVRAVETAQAVAAVVAPVWEQWAAQNKPVTEPLGTEEAAPITHERQLYMASDEVAKPWYAVRNAAIQEAFPGTKDGYCPALLARNAVIDAETALIALYVEKAGLDAGNVYGKLRQELLVTLLEAPHHADFF